MMGNLSSVFRDGFYARSTGRRECRIDYALQYAELGWRVFPLHHIADGHCSCGVACRSPGKHPRTPAGVNDATTDAAAIQVWWQRWPDANIGAATGRESGIWALDVDPRNGGDVSLEQLKRNCTIPDTVEQLTGGGGVHLLFAYPSNVRIRSANNKVGPGLDVKSDGGYIVVEPSSHASGTNYAWEGSSDPLEGVKPQPAPDYLLGEVLARHSATPAAPGPSVNALAEWKVAELRGALAVVPADDRDVWLEIGMALHATGAGQQTFGIWCEWSQGSDKYDAADQARVWASFGEQSGVTLSSLYGLAKRHGWVDPGTPAQATGAAPDSNRFEILTPSELMLAPRPKWLVRNLLPGRGLAVMYGPSGSGKTFAALDLAFAIVRGRSWFGVRVKTGGGIIYIATEGAMRLRVEAYCSANAIEKRDIDRVGFLESGINLLDPRADVAALAAAVQTHAGKIGAPIYSVIIDTLNRSMPGGNENASEDMGAVIGCAKQLEAAFGCLVLFVHHSGKNESAGSRGHSSLKAATDAEISVRRDGNFRFLRAEKVRDGLDGIDLGVFKLRPVDLGAVSDDDPEASVDERYQSCVLDLQDASEIPPSVKLTKQQNAMLDCIHKAFDASALPAPASLFGLQKAPKGGQNVVTRGDIFEILDLHGGLSAGHEADTESRARRRALNDLQRVEIIRIHEDLIWLWPI